MLTKKIRLIIEEMAKKVYGKNRDLIVAVVSGYFGALA